jgi:porin
VIPALRITRASNISLLAFHSVWLCMLLGPLTSGASDVPQGEPAEDKDYFPSSKHLTGNWGGTRDQLREKGIDLQLNYTSEPMRNVSGGENSGFTYIHNVGFALGLDLDKMFGGGDTTFLLKVAQRTGPSVSRRNIAPSEDGNAFPVQEAYGNQVTQIVNVQLETTFLDKRLDFAYGRIVANDDFLSTPMNCQFVNNSFCGSAKAVFLQSPWAYSAYPTAQWGVRGRYNTESDNWTFLSAVFDADIKDQNGNPAKPARNTHGTNWSMGGNGVVLANEIHYNYNHNNAKELSGTYKIGGFYMSGDYQNLNKTDNSTVNDNAMVYLQFDQQLYHEHAGRPQGLGGFFTYLLSLKDKANTMDNYFNAGLLYTGLFASRSQDIAGIAVTTGWYTNELHDARKAEGKKKQDYEAVIELNYKFILPAGLQITPDVQYVIHPAGRSDINNALVIGGRVSLTF